MNVAAILMLSGDLEVSLLEGFDPQGGSWVVATASDFLGQFASVTSGFAVSLERNHLVLSVVAPLSSDCNGDHNVNLADYT